MINDNQKYFNRMQVLIDGAVIVISYVLSWYLYIEKPQDIPPVERGVLPPQTYMMALLFIVPCYLILYYACNLYTSKRLVGRRLEIANIIKANTIGMLILSMLIYMLKIMHFSRGVFWVFFVTNLVAEIIVRNIIYYCLSNMWKNGKNQKQILMVGYSRATEEYIDRIIANPEWGYVVRGILDDHVKAGTTYRGIKVLGRIGNLMVILPENKLDEIAITLGLNEYYRLEEIVAMCEKSGVHTQFVPDYHNIIPTKPYTEDLQGLPVINIRYVPLNNTFLAAIKRGVDIIGALVAIVLFEMYKFRSMEVQPEETEKKAWTVKNDPRVTGYGKFMRHTSIDELPQLFNILKGDMSLVGPRPERPFFVEKFREEIPRYMVKHQVRPGLTGWAQVNGYRGDTSIRKRIDCDLYYIENWTLGLDFKILFLTFFKGFVNKNAY